MDKSSKYSAQEYLCSHMTFIEQYAESVLEYSSKYNSVMSISYAPENVTGKANRYPNYGDFPDTYILVCMQIITSNNHYINAMCRELMEIGGTTVSLLKITICHKTGML